MGANKYPIEHIIVLMMENRSYDHMLGYLPNGYGLTGQEYNLVDPADLASEKVFVSDRAGYIIPVDPSHDVVNVERQIYGRVGHVVQTAPMSGFVKVHIERTKGDVAKGKKIMDCFKPAMIPALTTLTQEFVLCTRWHCSVPGPTWINRFFAHAATSDGVSKNDATHFYNARTIYDLLSGNGFTWNVYYNDVPQCILLQHGGDRLGHFKRFHQFHKDLKSGGLASYTFIEPRYLSFFQWKGMDQHPPNDVSLGEYMIAEVYDSLRASPYWEKSLLVILWDEHGGFFDHVPPPDGVPNPDGQVAVDPPFDFTRLGVRVPAVLVSPWVEKGQIDSTLYEHASLPATVEALFGLPEALTARDRAANSFLKNVSRTTPRTDAPKRLPVPGLPARGLYHRRLLRVSPLEQWLLGKVDQRQKSQAPLTLYQESLVELADRLNAEAHAEVPPRAGQIQQENEAAVYVHESVMRALGG